MKKLLLLLLCCASFAAFSQPLTGEKKIVKDAVVNFFNWYKTGWKGFEQYKLYTGDSAGKDGPPYKIDWLNVGKHFQWIRQNAPLLSEEFLQNETIFFKYCDSMFKKNPTDEMPIGFDYERILGGQEDVALVLKSGWLNPKLVWKVKWIGSSKAEVTALKKGAVENDETDRMMMVKEKGKWKVALPPGMGGNAPFEKETTK